MAVIISNGDVNISTVNGFYRVEAHNLMPLNVNYLGLGTTRYIPITFANAGNCRGLGLMLQCTGGAMDRGITIDLQQIMGAVTMTIANPCVVTFNSHGLADGTLVEFSTTGALPTGITAGTQYYVRNSTANTFNLSTTPAGALVITTGSQSGTHTLCAVRATDSFTYAQIINGTTGDSVWTTLTVPLPFTTPFAVDTTASKWRFRIAHNGGTTGAWLLETSDGTNACYFAWCDNQLSYSANDTLICKDIVTIDQSCTFGGVLGTGEATDPVAVVICRCKTNPTPANVANLVWQNPPASSYTMTLKGHVVLGAWAGFRVGTSSSRIAKAVQAIIVWDTLTAGSQTGFTLYRGGTAPNCKSSLFLYGEYPNYVQTTLAAQANSGQKDLVTTDTTGWAVGDVIAIGRQNASGYGDQSQYVINTIAGANINLTTNIATNHRMAGGAVVNISAYGIWMYGTVTVSQRFASPNNFVLDGVRLGSTSAQQVWTMAGSQSFYLTSENDTYTSTWLIANCSSSTTATGAFLASTFIQLKGLTINNVVHVSGFFAGAGISASSLSGIYTVTNLTLLAMRNSNTAVFYTPAGGRAAIVNGLKIENTDGFAVIYGTSLTFKNCKFWGGASTLGIVRPYTLVKTLDWSGNSYDKSACAINLGAAVAIEAIFKDEIFGASAANTYDFNFDSGGSYFDIILKSPTGTPNVDATYLGSCILGSKLAITDNNDTPNMDLSYTPFGKLARTGTGLADTTQHGSGGFAIRLESASPSNRLEWSQTIPTGNIQSKTMVVAVWVKINNAAYYGGTHQKPRLTINYDDGTLIYAEAAATTAWQLISVAFAPTTSFGQIIATLSTMTDQTGSSAYVYFDDYAVLYPPGVQLNLGSLDLWANALPVVPSIATNLSAQDVWTALQATNYGAGTMGELLKETEKKVDDNQALILGS